MKNEIIHEFIVCDCQSLEHHFVITVAEFDDQKPMIDVSLRMSTYLTFWKRVITAFKFIFRYPFAGEYDGVMLKNKDIDKIISILEPYKGKLDH
jgi:hypothetical protein